MRERCFTGISPPNWFFQADDNAALERSFCCVASAGLSFDIAEGGANGESLVMSNAFNMQIAYPDCMQSLIRLKHIIAVARSGGFSIAAEEVGISQPALSRSIQAFEAEYNVRLFYRGKGGATLTPAGMLAVEQARGVLAAASDFDRDMRLFGRGQAGTTGVGMGPMIASLLLPRLGSVLLQRSPQITFLTHVGQPERMLEALLDGTIELIVGNSWQLSLIPGVTEERLGVLQLAVVVRAEHPLARVREVTMDDLDRFPAARPFDYPTAGKTSSGGAFICENFSILHEVVLQTDCTWLVSPALIRKELEQGCLVQLKVMDLPVAQTQINLVHTRGRTQSPAGLLLADVIRSTVRQMGTA